MLAPDRPKLYHICHVDRLPSIVASGGLLSDAAVGQHKLAGTMIGMSNIKQRRLTELQLASHPGLFVGQCVPFYFCPRSVMLYLIHRQNAELANPESRRPRPHHSPRSRPAHHRCLGRSANTSVGVHQCQCRLALLR